MNRTSTRPAVRKSKRVENQEGDFIGESGMSAQCSNHPLRTRRGAVPLCGRPIGGGLGLDGLGNRLQSQRHVGDIPKRCLPAIGPGGDYFVADPNGQSG